MKIVVASLVVVVLFSVNGVAQEYTRWGLPEGAKMRLGKGQIFLMKYSPDGSRLAIASSIGVWLYDTETYKEAALLTGDSAAAGGISFNSTGSELVGRSSVGAGQRRDVKTGAVLGAFSVRTQPYGRSAMSLDGRVLAC